MSAALHTRLVEMRTRHDELSESLGSDVRRGASLFACVCAP
jgi:hypothetical protein